MVEINNLSSELVDESFFKEIIQFILEKENQDGDVSIALVKPKEIRKLNNDYRKKDFATDVLSFSNKNDIIKIKGRNNFIGEIVLCPKKIIENAREFGVNFTKELYWALVHGLLHLLGYEHNNLENTKKMREKEKYYLKFFNK